VSESAYLFSFTGGAFLSQIPEDAEIVIANPTTQLEAMLRARASADSAIRYSFVSSGVSLTIQARGLSAHSSRPNDGRNAITHLAALLADHDWPDTQAARMVRLINDLVGLGDYGEKFGDVAFTHPFMGPLTLSLTTLSLENADLVAGINIRSPVGRSGDQLERAVREAVQEWNERTGVDVNVSIVMYEPYYLEDAPHIPILLDIFEFYTGNPNPQPIAIGGGTHAQLVPNGVNFGPAMPGEVYTGHTEHEFITREQYLLNLKMYTALLAELAGTPMSTRLGPRFDPSYE
jgi:dipeptidase D